MKKVEASAKTREEAIQDALKQLGVEMYEVDKIEVLDEGSKGLFGFGARPVRVRLVVENMPDDPQRDEESENRPRRNNRERGPRKPARESQGETKSRDEGRSRGGRPERSENKERGEGRGEGRGRGRSDKPREERANKERAPRAESSGESIEPSRGSARIRGDKDGENTQNENPRARGGRGRNERDDRDRKPSRERTPREAREERAPRSERAPRAPREEREAAPVNGDAISPSGVVEDIIDPITDEQGNEAATLLEEIITKMGIEAKAAFTRSEDGSARLNVTSEDSAILIGRKGRNLSAMQYLVNRMISQGDTHENTERLVVDVEGYVDRRRESLQELARSMASRAKESQRNMRLKPLSPQERRIIHLTLEDDEDIRTFSLGESLYRSVVISPKGATQPDRNRNSRGGRGGRRRGGRGRSQSQSREQTVEQGAEPRRGADQDLDVGTFGD